MNGVELTKYFYWNPSKFVFSWNIPFLGRPILWYGVFFVLGFFCSYLAFISFLKKDTVPFVKNNAKKIAEKGVVYAIVGTTVGARLFEVIFYQSWEITSSDFLSIIRVWEGGLSSHGGVVGMVIAFIIFQRRYKYFSYLHLLDLASASCGIGGFCIRMGNFFNQEILGKPSTLPWSVIFGNPIDGSLPTPRHPVQLYEAFFYLSVFVLLRFLYKPKGKEGFIFGILMVLVFCFRFLIEFVKEDQGSCFASSPLTMGQLLSIPFVIIGFLLIFRKNCIQPK